MSYEGSKSYKEYKIIEGISLLVNMVNQIKDEKKTLKDIYENWINTGFLSFANQIDFISGTAADNLTSKYLAYCINQLNSYIMSKYPNHRGLASSLTTDILNAINMAIQANAHIWTQAQLQSIQAAFMSSHVTKPIVYPESSKEKKDKKKKQKNLEYKIE